MRGVPTTLTSVRSGRLRWLVAIAAVGLLLTPLAPWYERSVTARTLHGRARAAVAFTGWQALSLSAIVCVLVAVAILLLLVMRGRIRVEGLGATGRRVARTRIDGALAAAGGALCVVLLTANLLDPGHPGAPLPGSSAATTGCWGIELALVVALALTALGLALLASASAGDAPTPNCPERTDTSTGFDFDFPVSDQDPTITRHRGAGRRRTAPSRSR